MNNTGGRSRPEFEEVFMKRVVFFGSFLLMATTASTAFAYYPAAYWRCSADQLGGSPSSPLESRQAYGRTTWAKNAFTYHKSGPNPNAALADRFWQGWMSQEVADAAVAQTPIDLYPVYSDPNSPSGIWIGPGPKAAPTWHGNTFTEIKTRPYTLPTLTTKVDALCEAGCYTPEQELRFGDELIPVAAAFESTRQDVTTLAPGSTFDSLSFIQNRVARWTVDIAPAEQTIITLRMDSGGELRVTTEHPLLTSEGVMKKATELVVGESLVKEDGSPDPIASMERNTIFTKVYNLRPATTDLISNILVAQGYLNGSARYQSEYVKYLNRVLMRNNIPEEVIPRSRATEGKEAGERRRTAK
jgi:hypothetical protein